MAVMQTTADQPKGISLYRAVLWLQLPLLAILLYWGGGRLLAWLDQPLVNIDLSGELRHTDAKSLRLRVWDSIDAPYLDIDLGRIKALLEADPWIYQVDVRRQWPSGLAIRVAEERAVARWGCKALLNADGDVFQPAGSGGYAHLPCLKGPDNRALELMEQYRSLSQQVRPLRLNLTTLELEPRGAWSLTLNNGIRVILGRNNVVEKMERFERVYGSQLIRYADKIKQIDVRYTNGLTVTWNQLPKA